MCYTMLYMLEWMQKGKYRIVKHCIANIFNSLFVSFFFPSKIGIKFNIFDVAKGV